MRSLAAEVGHSMADPAEVTRRLAESGSARPFRPVGLVSSPLSVALLHSELHQAGLPGRWDAAAMTWFDLALRQAAGRRLGAGLIEGVAGYVVALSSLAAWHPPAERTLSRFVELLSGYVLSKVRPRRKHVLTTDFDILYGASGVLLALLLVSDAGNGRSFGTARSAEAVRRCADELTDYARFQGGFPSLVCTREGCLRPEEFLGDQVDLGMAHGVPGVVSALSALTLSPQADPRATEAGATLARWLGDQGGTGPCGPEWAAVVFTDSGMRPRRSRTAWCYGSPGVALALHRAGTAFAQPELSRRAAVVASNLRERSAEDPILRTASICHGVAGVALVASIVGGDTVEMSRLLAQECARLPGPFVVRDRRGGYDTDDVPEDDAGYLSGSSGVGLAALHLAGHPTEGFLRGALLG